MRGREHRRLLRTAWNEACRPDFWANDLSMSLNKIIKGGAQMTLLFPGPVFSFRVRVLCLVRIRVRVLWQILACIGRFRDKVFVAGSK
jgi:hypothetical protein